MNVKDWKTLERHPLSAEYVNIDGKPWESFVAGLRINGIINDRPITIHEDKVLDGWQLLRGCIEADIKPKFKNLPEGIDPESFVEAMNDRRRHEDAATTRKRADARRSRVLEGKAEGKSNRVIADEEGVDEKTIRTDIETTDADLSALLPPDGKVTGKDGKKQSATKNTRKKKAPAKPKEKDAVDAAGTLLDSIEIAVPPGLIPVFNTVKTFRGIVNQLNDINRVLGELHKGPAGSKDRLQGEQIDLRNLKESVHFDTPYAVCPVCKGIPKTRKANCPCKQRGWLVETAYKNLPMEYRA